MNTAHSAIGLGRMTGSTRRVAGFLKIHRPASQPIGRTNECLISGTHCSAGHPFPSNMNVNSRVSHEHLKSIWRINRNSLKVLGCHTVHAGHS